MYGRIKRIHFVGIGGIGMSGIAEVLLNLGYTVSGSDLRASRTTERLASLGARIHIGHDPSNIAGAEVVVTSSAVKADNPEVTAARAAGLPVIPRAEMLAELMRLKYGIAVAGSHGKTTTTTMVAAVLAEGGFDPTVVVGGRVQGLGTNAKVGKGEFMVAEADESDGSFLMLSPSIAVLTNIDAEHLDHYGDIEALKDAFVGFLNKVPFYGLCVVCADCEHASSVVPRLAKRHVTYGFAPRAELRAVELESCGEKTAFTVLRDGAPLGRATVNQPGAHNVQNALAAIAVGMELGIGFDCARRALERFEGIERRLELKGRPRGVAVVDDYGHHPEEIRATVEAVRQWLAPRRLVVVFQPHRYSRTKRLFDDFVRVLSKADRLYILDVYAAGEPPVEGVSAERLRNEMEAKGYTEARYVPRGEDVAGMVAAEVREGDVVLTLGAGDVWRVAEKVVEALS